MADDIETNCYCAFNCLPWLCKMILLLHHTKLSCCCCTARVEGTSTKQFFLKICKESHWLRLCPKIRRNRMDAPALNIHSLCPLSKITPTTADIHSFAYCLKSLVCTHSILLTKSTNLYGSLWIGTKSSLLRWLFRPWHF